MKMGSTGKVHPGKVATRIIGPGVRPGVVNNLFSFVKIDREAVKYTNPAYDGRVSDFQILIPPGEFLSLPHRIIIDVYGIFNFFKIPFGIEGSAYRNIILFKKLCDKDKECFGFDWENLGGRLVAKNLTQLPAAMADFVLKMPGQI